MNIEKKYYADKLLKDAGVKNQENMNHLKNILSETDGENVEKYFQEKMNTNELSSLKQSIIDGGNLLDSNIAMESIDKMLYLKDTELVKNINNSFKKHLINPQNIA